MARFWAYILQCADRTYYAGSTNDLKARLKLHQAGRGAKYVRGRGPLTLVYAKAYPSSTLAIREECRVKRLTRAQKHALIKQSA